MALSLKVENYRNGLNELQPRPAPAGTVRIALMPLAQGFATSRTIQFDENANR